VGNITTTLPALTNSNDSKKGTQPKLPRAHSAKPKVIYPQGFAGRSDGIWFSASSDGNPSRVCGQITFVAMTRDENGNNWGIELAWPDRDGREHHRSFPLSLLSGDTSQVRAALLDGGCWVSSSPQGKIKFAELLGGVIIEARALAVDKVGWAGPVFVLPHMTIGDSPSNRVIYQSADEPEHSFGSKGDIGGWQSLVAYNAIGNSRLILAISLAFVGPLLALLGEEGGGLNLRGPSSTGKSTALFVAASVWGPPAFVHQWRATSNGIEGICVQHSEVLLCLDELAQLNPAEAAFIAYMIANGSGKARANRHGSLRRSAKWRVPFLSSGEISLADLAGRDAKGGKRSAAGQEIRILDVPADAGAGMGLFENLHDAPSADAFARQIKSGTETAYGVAGPAFVQQLVSHFDGIDRTAKRKMDEFVAENLPQGANGQVSRALRRFALIAAAGEMAIHFGIVPWPKGEANKACATIFRQWLDGRGGSGSAEDREAINRVRGFLEMHGGSRFEPVEAIDDSVRIHNRAGFWRDTDTGREFLFLAEAWKTEVCAGMDAARVAKTLAEQGYLRKDSAGKNSITVTLPGLGKSRCYAVSARIFESDVGA